jgi:hypothetical protein
VFGLQRGATGGSPRPEASSSQWQAYERPHKRSMSASRSTAPCVHQERNQQPRCHWGAEEKRPPGATPGVSRGREQERDRPRGYRAHRTPSRVPKLSKPALRAICHCQRPGPGAPAPDTPTPRLTDRPISAMPPADPDADMYTITFAALVLTGGSPASFAAAEERSLIARSELAASAQNERTERRLDSLELSRFRGHGVSSG